MKNKLEIYRESIMNVINPNSEVEKKVSEIQPAAPLDPKEVFRQKLQETFHTFFVPPASPSPMVSEITERENPISVETLKGTITKLGPKGLGETVAGLSTDMNKVDQTGAPASEFSLFVDSIKQDGLEILTSGNTTPTAVDSQAPVAAEPQSVTGATPAPAEGGDDLANLVPPTAQ